MRSQEGQPSGGLDCISVNFEELGVAEQRECFNALKVSNQELSQQLGSNAKVIINYPGYRIEAVQGTTPDMLTGTVDRGGTVEGTTPDMLTGDADRAGPLMGTTPDMVTGNQGAESNSALTIQGSGSNNNQIKGFYWLFRGPKSVEGTTPDM